VEEKWEPIIEERRILKSDKEGGGGTTQNASGLSLLLRDSCFKEEGGGRSDHGERGVSHEKKGE